MLAIDCSLFKLASLQDAVTGTVTCWALRMPTECQDKAHAWASPTASCMSNPFCSKKKQEGVQVRKLGAADPSAIIAIEIVVSSLHFTFYVGYININMAGLASSQSDVRWAVEGCEQIMMFLASDEPQA